MSDHISPPSVHQPAPCCPIILGDAPRTALHEPRQVSWRIPLLRPRSIFSFALLALSALALPGCEGLFGPRKPPPLEFTMYTPYDSTRTLAIAPTVNLSGSRDFDPLVVSDTVYSEMQQVQNLNVLPLNKTLLAMQRLGIRSIDDPKAAQQLAAYLHADGLVIPAVTAYDPYNPPTVGMVLQLYTPPAPPPPPEPTVRTPPVRVNPDTVIYATDIPNPAAPPRPPTPAQQPASQVTAVFNATNQTVLRELHIFATGRTQYDAALTEQRFLVDADSYMRFVCHAMVRRLMDVERARVSDR
jgi:hypothetical protein